MGKIIIEEKKLIYRRKDELTVIEPYGENCLRCRSTRNSRLLNENWTVLEPSSADTCVITGDDTENILEQYQSSYTLYQEPFVLHFQYLDLVLSDIPQNLSEA